MNPSSPTKLQRLAAIAFWLWAPVPVVVIGLLMGGHLLTLPRPNPSAVAALERSGTGWRAIHVLAERCGCSRQVLRHLFERSAAPGFSEKVLFIGDDLAAEAQALAAGYAFERIDPSQLEARYGIRGAPLLVVVDPSDRVVYSGGYAATQRGAPEDSEIFSQLRALQAVEARPLFGCAVSQRLQRQLDPLGLSLVGLK